jgi:hypothetical protein
VNASELREAVEAALGAMSWWQSDGDPNEDVGDLKGAAARLRAALPFMEAAMAEEEEWMKDYRNSPDKGVKRLNDAQAATHAAYRALKAGAAS